MRKFILPIAALLIICFTIASAASYFTVIVKSRIVNNGSYVSVPATLASATTITIPEYGELFFITGTANCTRILPGTGTYEGRVIRLWHTTTDTLTDGVNLVLAGNFNGTANDIITLVQKDTFFVEIDRSVN